MEMSTTIFIITARKRINQSNVPNLVFAKRNWTNKFPLCFKNFLCARIGRKNYLLWQKKIKQYPPNPFLLLFRKPKVKSAPYKRSSSDFLMDTWSRTLSEKSIAQRKQSCYPKRSRWTRKWRGLNKSRMIGSNLSKAG